jgi:hypothetical protein
MPEYGNNYDYGESPFYKDDGDPDVIPPILSDDDLEIDLIPEQLKKVYGGPAA